MASLREFADATRPARKCAICELPEEILQQVDDAMTNRHGRDIGHISRPQIMRWLAAEGYEHLNLGQFDRHTREHHRSA